MVAFTELDAFFGQRKILLKSIAKSPIKRLGTTSRSEFKTDSFCCPPFYEPLIILRYMSRCPSDSSLILSAQKRARHC